MILRAGMAVILATLYWLCTIPLALAGFVLVPFVIWTSKWHTSPLTGERIFGVPSGPLFLWSNAQDGLDPPWAVQSIYKGWPTFWRRYSWAAWRNKVRNLSFVPWLAFLHRPKGEIHTRVFRKGKWLVKVEWRGWMTEISYYRGQRFGKFGPRLEQPFGHVSWAMRPWGKW